MTVDKCLILLKQYKRRMEDQSEGVDELERELIKKQNTKAYKDMRAHILSPKSKKFRDHPIREELLAEIEEEKKSGEKEVKETPVKEEKKQEVKKSGKKSKG